MRAAVRPTLALAALLAACSSSSGGPAGWPAEGGRTDGGVGQTDSAALDGTAGDGSVADSSAIDGATSEGSATTDSGAPVDAGSGEAGVMQTVEMTFYGWDDNSPPGGSIAYPKNGGFPTIHDVAGGTGTYADPITYATDKSELPIGTIVYAPVILKYLVMEDDCGQCDTDWGSMTWHIDVWMNSNGTETASALDACEDQWTQSATTIEVNPPPGRMVDPTPLFDPSTNTCSTNP
jgi:hypothetical protein